MMIVGSATMSTRCRPMRHQSPPRSRRTTAGWVRRRPRWRTWFNASYTGSIHCRYTCSGAAPRDERDPTATSICSWSWTTRRPMRRSTTIASTRRSSGRVSARTSCLADARSSGRSWRIPAIPGGSRGPARGCSMSATVRTLTRGARRRTVQLRPGPRRRRERAVLRVDPKVSGGTKSRAKRGHAPGGTDSPRVVNVVSFLACAAARGWGMAGGGPSRRGSAGSGSSAHAPRARGAALARAGSCSVRWWTTSRTPEGHRGHGRSDRATRRHIRRNSCMDVKIMADARGFA